MLENDEHKEKKNFTESEIEVLLAEVEVRAGTLFGSLSSGLSHKTKFVAWQCIAQAVNEVGGQQRSLKDVKKKNMKLQSKKRVVFSLHDLQYFQEALMLPFCFLQTTTS